MIKSGKIKEAQQAAKVELLGQDVKSYSGYLTVGLENCGSNLFFWFFPAMVNFIHNQIIYNYIHINYYFITSIGIGLKLLLSTIVQPW